MTWCQERARREGAMETKHTPHTQSTQHTRNTRNTRSALKTGRGSMWRGGVGQSNKEGYEGYWMVKSSRRVRGSEGKGGKGQGRTELGRE